MADVILRAQTADDADILYRIASETDTWEERGPSRPGTLTREAWDARNAARDADGSSRQQFIIEVDGDAVGEIGLMHIDELARHAEVGISLVEHARGKGIGTAAMAQIIEHAFVRGNLRRLHLEVIASNARAIRSYEKAGFAIEGRLREHAWVRGHYEDIILMGLLRDESRGRESISPRPPARRSR